MYLIEYRHIYNESYLISSRGDITHVIMLPLTLKNCWIKAEIVISC